MASPVRLPPSRIRSSTMASLAAVRMPFASYREVSSVDRPCSAASTVSQARVAPLKRASRLPRSPWAHGRPSPRAGDLTATDDTSVDLDTEDVNSLNCPAMGRTYLSTTQGPSRRSMNSLRYRDFQFGVGDGEPTEAVLMSAPRNGSSGAYRMLRERRLPREAAGQPATPPAYHPSPGWPLPPGRSVLARNRHSRAVARQPSRLKTFPQDMITKGVHHHQRRIRW